MTDKENKDPEENKKGAPVVENSGKPETVTGQYDAPGKDGKDKPKDKPDEEKSLQELIDEMNSQAEEAQEELGIDSAKFEEAVEKAVAERTAAIQSQAKEEIAQIKIRARDEVDSVRRRADVDAENAKNRAIGKFARDMLEFADNFQRAVDAIPAETLAGNEQLKTLIEGLHAMEASLQSTFNKHGIEKFESKGEKFDPNRHEAMFEVPAADGQEPGTVGQVAQDGYMMKGRLLRPARVGVVKKP